MKKLLLFVLPIMMTGCASHPPLLSAPAQPPEALFPEKPIVTPVDAVTRPDIALIWSASGKMAIHLTQPDGHESAGTIYYVWQQHGNLYRITLSGPLGQGRTVIEGTPERVTLDSAKTGHMEASTPENLMQSALGWSAPVSYLRKWIQGLPATDQAETVADETGILKTSLESPWQADFKSWQPAGKFLLPEKVVITGPDTTLTLLVSRWNVE